MATSVPGKYLEITSADFDRQALAFATRGLGCSFEIVPKDGRAVQYAGETRGFPGR